MIRSTRTNISSRSSCGFRRQTDHHIELDGQHSAVENRAADVDDLVIGQIFVDDAAQAVGTGFRSDGDLLVARFDKGVEQFVGDLVEPSDETEMR